MGKGTRTFVIFAVLLSVILFGSVVYLVWSKYDKTQYLSDISTFFYNDQQTPIYATYDDVTTIITHEGGTQDNYPKLYYYLTVRPIRAWLGADESQEPIILARTTGETILVYPTDSVDEGIVCLMRGNHLVHYKVSIISLWSNLKKGVSADGFGEVKNTVTDERVEGADMKNGTLYTFISIAVVVIIVLALMVIAYAVWAKYDVTTYNHALSCLLFSDSDAPFVATYNGVSTSISHLENVKKIDYYLRISPRRVWLGADKGGEPIVLEFGKEGTVTVYPQRSEDRVLVCIETAKQHAQYSIKANNIWNNLQRAISPEGWSIHPNEITKP